MKSTTHRLSCVLFLIIDTVQSYALFVAFYLIKKKIKEDNETMLLNLIITTRFICLLLYK